MVKFELTSILFSNKNLDLAYKLHKCCLKMSINLVTCLNFVDLTFKLLQLKPEIIFCDMTTVDFSSSNLKLMLENEEYKKTKIVFIGNEQSKRMIDSLLLNDFDFVFENNIVDYLENNLELLRFACMVNKQTDAKYSYVVNDVADVLFELGFSPKHTGFSYLREIIINIIRENGVVNSLIANQYPPIAAKFKTTCCNIERNIRNAIGSAYYRMGSTWNKLFENALFLSDNKKPTNREFICMCTQYIMNNITQKMLKQSYA